ncbi:hypothetical protein WN55_10706 [Dufourea novaeangliae]|uniref:Uncharacterized protein n=1 Tax=Dufourea novaeangliae TaxID=178035 RepID=A0A154PBB7_DUFNO|nr:hypothetical protein WN55_10706 [Dufourea novaeangliae]
MARAWFTSLGTVRKKCGNLSLLLRNGEVDMYEICGTEKSANTEAICESGNGSSYNRSFIYSVAERDKRRHGATSPE